MSECRWCYRKKSQDTKSRQNTAQIYLVQTFDWRSHVSALKTCECFALKFLNEAFIGVEVASLNETSKERWSLSQESTKMLNFIYPNGPHPLVSMNLVQKFLDDNFGDNWHFTIHKSNHFVSKVVDAHFKETQALPNSLIELSLTHFIIFMWHVIWNTVITI